jgi:hypothetical protein
MVEIAIAGWTGLYPEDQTSAKAGPPAGIRVALRRNCQFLAHLDLVRIAEFIFVRFKDLHVLASITIELLRNLRQCVAGPR